MVNLDGQVFGTDLKARSEAWARDREGTFIPHWRAQQSSAFDLRANSTAREIIALDLWGKPTTVYANANLLIYSSQACNARCAFCVEELRPASRGVALNQQDTVEVDDARYFTAMQTVLDALSPLNPVVAMTGGEPSQDPRLPRIVRTLQTHGARKSTLTTNGSGLLDVREGRPLIDWIADSSVAHLNIGRAQWGERINAKLMRYGHSPNAQTLREIVGRAQRRGTRVRLSCLLVANGIDDVAGVLRYLDFAVGVGVDNVIFRQLVQIDPSTTQANFVTKVSDRRRVAMMPLLAERAMHAGLTFQRQVMGYYYYVELRCYRGIDVVFEGAELAQLERTKASMPDVIQELIFHPNARLASTWQPWEGVLGPPALM